MTLAEFIGRLGALDVPGDTPVVLVVDPRGSFADPKGCLVRVAVHEEMPGCSLPLGEQEVLLLYTAYTDPLADLPDVDDEQ